MDNIIDIDHDVPQGRKLLLLMLLLFSKTVGPDLAQGIYNLDNKRRKMYNLNSTLSLLQSTSVVIHGFR